jgi:hypothetical protein
MASASHIVKLNGYSQAHHASDQIIDLPEIEFSRQDGSRQRQAL